jgi:hypothetical protein
MNDLRSTFQRLADSAEPLPVDDDLWQRAQAARRRGQVLVAAAVLAIIASVTWSAVLLGTGDREARTASQEVPGGAIPSRIEDVPSDLEATTDLAVGTVSAAFISGLGDPVVITAVDGMPHRLDLPGWVRNGTQLGDPLGNQSLALSPDGERLAWQAADTDDGRPVVGVLDLSTGTWKPYATPPHAQLSLREMSWSPDSTWLTWIGDDGDGSFIGRMRPQFHAQNNTTALDGAAMDAAISSDGTVIISRPSGGLFRVNGVDLVRLPGATGGAGRFSPDGRLLALRSSVDPASYTYDLAADQVLTHTFPPDTFADGYVLPQGWLDDRLQLLLVQESTQPDHRELVVTTPETSPTSTWRRSVGVVEAGPAVTLSLAVDLVPDLDGTSSQQLTHDFGDPLADQQRDISWMIGLGVAAAIAVLMGLRWLLRRLLG